MKRTLPDFFGKFAASFIVAAFSSLTKQLGE